MPSPAPAAIAMLRDKEPGSFVVRDSHSFRGAYGLAMKVATPPPSVLQLNKKGGCRPPTSWICACPRDAVLTGVFLVFVFSGHFIKHGPRAKKELNSL